jgi:hypothetical protein
MFTLFFSLFKNQHLTNSLHLAAPILKDTSQKETQTMPIPRIFPHYPKPNPIPPLKCCDPNSLYQTTDLLKTDDTLDGLPMKKLTIIETEPILAEDSYATTGPRNINPSQSPRTNENAWSLVNQLKLTWWGHSFIAGDYQDVFELDKKAHIVMMTTMDNFAREVKPQQLHHFFNLHICNLDNIDLFYQYYYENVLMEQPTDFLYHNLGVYSPVSIEQKRDWIQKWTKTEHRTFSERFVTFTAASLIFDTVNSCTANAFKNNDVLHGLVEGIHLAEKHSEVLEDFCNFVQNNLLIRAASPLTIREIV